MPAHFRHHRVLTVNGVEGACAAAFVLIKYPDARIRITSPRHLPYALADLADEGYDGAVHVCGIGLSIPFEDVLPPLQRLVKKAHCFWYSGTSHPELRQHRDAIAKYCSLNLPKYETDAEAVAGCLLLVESAQLLLLIGLAKDEQAGRKPRSELYRFLRDLVLAANRRFFFYGDDTLNERVFRYLAGLEGKTDDLEQVVEEFRRSDDVLYPLGSSKAMKELRKQIGLLGPVPEPLLVYGPTGSGKEVMARTLHVTSGRKGTFVAVNCAVLGGNPALVEDRLFGHVKGAYTGAIADAKGAFEEAHEGTLFLDEIGELPPEVQPQLLRVLEEKVVRPLGTMTTCNVDVRIVAATHRDLAGMVAQGKFREDLYYRLNVLTIRVPPLRERPEDMQSIAMHVNQELQSKGYGIRFNKKDWDALLNYGWPGNVRQFINIIKRATYLQKPMSDILAEENATQTTGPESGTESLLRLYCPRTPEEVSPADDVYQEYVRHVFELLDRNITKTARLLQIAPNTLRKHI